MAAPSLSQDEKDFVAGVSQQTGIDPRVLIAWIASEGHPGDTAHNYMNITVNTAHSLGEPVSGSLPPSNNPTAAFPDVQTGIDASVKEIKSLGLGNLKGMSPAQEIGAIAASPWAESHYGGPGGPNLQRVFSDIFGGGALGSAYVGSSQAQALSGNFPTKIGDATHAVTGAFSSASDLISFVTSWRFAEIVGGFLLLLVGLVLLGRQFGVSAPGSEAVARAARQ